MVRSTLVGSRPSVSPLLSSLEARPCYPLRVVVRSALRMGGVIGFVVMECSNAGWDRQVVQRSKRFSGFIQPEAGGSRCVRSYLRRRACRMSNLNEGQKVSYELEKGKQGKFTAVNLQAVRSLAGARPGSAFCRMGILIGLAAAWRGADCFGRSFKVPAWHVLPWHVPALTISAQTPLLIGTISLNGNRGS